MWYSAKVSWCGANFSLKLDPVRTPVDRKKLRKKQDLQGFKSKLGSSQRYNLKVLATSSLSLSIRYQHITSQLLY